MKLGSAVLTTLQALKLHEAFNGVKSKNLLCDIKICITVIHTSAYSSTVNIVKSNVLFNTELTSAENS